MTSCGEAWERLLFLTLNMEEENPQSESSVSVRPPGTAAGGS